MNPANQPGKWLNVRVPPADHQRLHELYKKSTCQSFSEFVRAVLLSRKIVFTTRDRSLDELIRELA